MYVAVFAISNIILQM